MINGRLQVLRDEMKKHGIAACIIPSSDPHQSEYLADHWKNREWITGFDGSAGLAVVTLEEAGLWTDSRYFLQAETQLANSTVELHKIFDRHHPSHLDWLMEKVKPGDKVAADGLLFSLNQMERIQKKLESKQIELETNVDLFKVAWKDRPNYPNAKIFEHEIKYAGETRLEKLTKVREALIDKKVNSHLISTLDDVAWLLNLRGSDIECNPVFLAYVIVEKEKAFLFVDESKLSDPIKAALKAAQIEIKNYEDAKAHLSELKESDSIWINKASTSFKLYQELERADVYFGKNICQHLKSQKNEVELKNFKDSMVNDGIALTKAFCWLEKTVAERGVSEYEFSEKLSACRSEMEGYHGVSFYPIVGYNANGAIIHYRPLENNCATIKNEGILLCDSGGQYLNGTTDITRTITFDAPAANIKNAYTRVLQGHIALASIIFPENVSGNMLDVLARKPLWEDQKNYLHGTGHGVGFFLNVHEGPQGIATVNAGNATTIFKEGMVTSNEPGYYEDGEYGIRIENLIVCQKASKEGFLKFETITLFPIDTRLIDKSLLSKTEITWLNEYHKAVFEKLGPLLDQKHQDWLKDKCQSI